MSKTIKNVRNQKKVRELKAGQRNRFAIEESFDDD
jgi:hypothetical protein